MTDLYGNPEQVDTPTTLLIEKRKGKKLESDSTFILGCKVFSHLSRAAVAEALRSAADAVEFSKAEKFTLEYRIEEVKKE